MKPAAVLLLLPLVACASDRAAVPPSIRPAMVGPRKAEGPVSRKLSVRVWADDAHQRMVIGWQVRIYKQIKRVNQVLRATLDVELEIVQVKAWERSSTLAHMDAALAELEATDPGADVDVVIGLLSPLPAVTSSFDQLGRARLLGKHLVMRGMDDAAEMEPFSRRGMSADAMDALYRARVQHKEEVVLLHELGHLLGALHVVSPVAIMSPIYDPKVARFDDANLSIMKIALLDQPIPALVEYLEGARFQGWVAGSRGRMLALLTGGRARLAGATDRDVSDGPPRVGEPVELSRGPLDEAERLLARGEDRGAYRLLKPLQARSPEDPQLTRATCVAAARLSEPSAADLCEAAARLNPEDPTPLLLQARLQRDDLVRALSLMAEAERRLPSDADAALLGFVASIYVDLGAVSLAERAAQRAPNTEESRAALAWVERTRQKYGLTPGTLAPEREPVYLRRRDELDGLLNAGKQAEAQEAADRLSRDFPKLGDTKATLCMLLVGRKAFREAEKVCARAVERRPDEVRLLSAAAIAAFGAGRPRRAIPFLERALQNDPDQRDLWSLLASAYLATQQSRKLSGLRARYQTRFGEAL